MRKEIGNCDAPGNMNLTSNIGAFRKIIRKDFC
jgi:hypothetical protein